MGLLRNGKLLVGVRENALSGDVGQCLTYFAIFQYLFDPCFREWQMIFVLLQPLVVILFDGVGPASVDLAGCVLPFFEAAVSEHIAQVRFFR